MDSISRKINICHVVARLDVGGMENGIVNICNRLDRKRFVPSILCLKGTGGMAKRLKPDVEIFSMDSLEGKMPLRFLTVARIFQKKRVDIVHAHGWGGGSFDGVIAARLAKVPAVINGEHGTFFLRQHQIYAQRILARLCNAQLSVSESLKNEYAKRIGIDASIIKVIRNGVDTDFFSGRHDTTRIKRELAERFHIDFNERDLFIGSIGSLKPLKNQMMLLRALDAIRQKRRTPGIKILFIGDGPDSARLKNFADEHGLDTNAFFLGERDDMPALLSLIDLVVSTSVSEGLSNVFLEAMSSGIPVISTDNEGARELLEDGLNGFLVGPEDTLELAGKIETLADNRELLNTLSLNARKFICEHYTLEKMVSSYEDFYADLLAGQRCQT